MHCLLFISFLISRHLVFSTFRLLRTRLLQTWVHKFVFRGFLFWDILPEAELQYHIIYVFKKFLQEVWHTPLLVYSSAFLENPLCCATVATINSVIPITTEKSSVPISNHSLTQRGASNRLSPSCISNFTYSIAYLTGKINSACLNELLIFFWNNSSHNLSISNGNSPFNRSLKDPGLFFSYIPFLITQYYSWSSYQTILTILWCRHDDKYL